MLILHPAIDALRAGHDDPTESERPGQFADDDGPAHVDLGCQLRILLGLVGKDDGQVDDAFDVMPPDYAREGGPVPDVSDLDVDVRHDVLDELEIGPDVEG